MRFIIIALTTLTLSACSTWSWKSTVENMLSNICRDSDQVDCVDDNRDF